MYPRTTERSRIRIHTRMTRMRVGNYVKLYIMYLNVLQRTVVPESVRFKTTIFLARLPRGHARRAEGARCVLSLYYIVLAYNRYNQFCCYDDRPEMDSVVARTLLPISFFFYNLFLIFLFSPYVLQQQVHIEIE